MGVEDRSYPTRLGRWPDGVAHQKMLRRVLEPYQFICDVGCGIGRMADIVEPEMYVGLDPDEEAIKFARSRHRDHMFFWMYQEQYYPKADVYFFMTVLQHVPDKKLSTTIEYARGKPIIVNEFMITELHRPEQNAWHRSSSNYLEIFSEHGYTENQMFVFPTKYEIPGIDMKHTLLKLEKP